MSFDRRVRSRKLPVLCTTTLASTLALALLTVPGVAPDEPSAVANVPMVQSLTNQGDRPTEHDLTLVTGDTVHVTETADGSQAATVTPAPRPDGSSTSFWTHRKDDDLYVIPHDFAGLIPDRLDPALFNVSQLLELGYADDETGALPVIATFDPQSRSGSRNVPAGEDVRRLESVNGLGMTLHKEEDTAALTDALTDLADPSVRTLATGPYAGLDKVWLDRPVESTLDESVPQVGAPHAWEQGYDGTGVTVAVLDTGIDTDHPDLADAVIEERNFSSSDTTDDRRGHGTHVASTLAGSGTASDGQYVGVAPEADLINGKVLNDFGSGQTSDVIDAMEWAAHEGADIVNMSLGERGNYSDGTDPASQAVDALTEQHDTLFVIAAGNEGPRAGTVTAPASADRALTVASVDKNGDIAETSSRGPRGGDQALKPDISGPGVDIVAARADGTSLGMPVNDSYTALGGTSMATPHVAGVAALLTQARPEIRGTQLKALLMSTAAPNDALGVLEQGAGRVDARTALTGQVISEPSSLSLGQYIYPHDDHDPVQRTVAYRNLGDTDIAIDLAVAAQNADGTAAPDGALTLSDSTVTVPAGGTAEVHVTLDPAIPGTGQFSGAITATTPDGQTMRTPIGYNKEPERYDVRIEALARDGRPAQGRFQVLDVEDGSVNAARNWGGSDTSCTTDSWGAGNCIRIAPGTYSISGVAFTMPESLPSTQPPGRTEDYLNATMLAEPEITIDGETTITMDAREASEVLIDTPDHETKRNASAARQVNYTRVTENGVSVSNGLTFGPRTLLEDRIFYSPTDEVTMGEMYGYSKWILEAPAITFDVADGPSGSDGIRLDPYYYDPYWFSDHSWQYPKLKGNHELPVVDVGTATADEIADVDLDGALALVRRADAIPVGEQSNNAAQAGAAMVAVYNDESGSHAGPGTEGIRLGAPTVRLSHEEGTALVDAVSDGAVTVEATGTPDSPYRYNLVLAEEGRFPEDLHYVMDTDEMAAVTNDFHSLNSEDSTLTESWYAYPYGATGASSFPMPTTGGPRTRTDYYVADPNFEYSQHVTTPEQRYAWRWDEQPQAPMRLRTQRTGFNPGERVNRDWFTAPIRPGVWPEDPIVRTDDSLDVRLAAFVDGAGHVSGGSTSYFDHGFTTLFEVYADGQRIIESPLTDGLVDVPEGTSEFRFEYDVTNDAPWTDLSTRTHSTWTFQTERPADGEERVEPLLTVDYDLDTDMHNRLPVPRERRGPHRITFSVGHQNGAPEIPIADADLEVSYDSGQTWRTLRSLRETGDGTFSATLRASAPEDSDGYLSLRVSAEDVDGNSVEQEIVRAYAWR